MKREQYRLLRQQMRTFKNMLRQTIRYQSMADSRLVVQISADHDDQRRIQKRINAIADVLPANGTDPLGFAPMYRMQKMRRSRVEYAARCRRRDREQIERYLAQRSVA